MPRDRPEAVDAVRALGGREPEAAASISATNAAMGIPLRWR